MRPGVFSESGFLGPEESLTEVLTGDAQALAELQLSREELVAPLEKLIEQAEAAPPRSARLENRIEIRIEVLPGFQICPWSPEPHRAQCAAGGGVRHASVGWHLRNLHSGDKLSGPGLIVHLIRAHGFFEGRQSPNRVDPRALAQIVELGPWAR